MLKKLEHALPDHPDMLTIYALDTLPRRDGRTEMIKHYHAFSMLTRDKITPVTILTRCNSIKTS